MYTSQERAQLRSELLAYAANDSRLSAAAITGSAAEDREDAWSDIDLAFGVADAAGMPNVLAHWTDFMYQKHGALHHMDVPAGPWIYRVFLLSNTLQVDLAFVPSSEFRALAPTFRLIFGEANEPRHVPPPGAEGIIGFAWLYALHVRSSIARGKLWQAEYMISGMRGQALALACLRHGLPADHGRGMDRLPATAIAPFEGSLVRHLDTAELRRAFGVVIEALRTEVGAIDADLARRLDDALVRLNDPETGAAQGS